MADSELANQRDLVLRGGKQARTLVWPENFRGVWIECHDDRYSVHLPGMLHSGRDDGLMAKMNAVKNTDREKNRAA
jgi:hypothetical protein